MQVLNFFLLYINEVKFELIKKKTLKRMHKILSVKFAKYIKSVKIIIIKISFKFSFKNEKN